MFATSQGPLDACFVFAANWKKGSGYCVLWGQLSAVQREVIEASKINECRNIMVGRLIWHFMHRTPVKIYERWQHHQDVVLNVQVYPPLEIFSCSPPSFFEEAIFVNALPVGELGSPSTPPALSGQGSWTHRFRLQFLFGVSGKD